MNLQNSRLDPSDQRTCTDRKWTCWHRWIPAWILAAHLGCFGLWPILQDFRAVAFLPFGLLLGHSYWFSAFGLPGSVQMLLAIFLAVLLFALPWLSALSSSPRASTICTLGVVAVLLMQLSGCWLQRQAAKTNTTLAREFLTLSSNPVGHPARASSSRAFARSALCDHGLQVIGIPCRVPRQGNNDPISMRAEINRIGEGLGADDQITDVPLTTSKGLSAFTCGNLLKSSPLNVSKNSTPWADITAAIRASWVFFPFTSWLDTRSRQSGKTAGRSPSMPKREVSAFNSSTTRAVAHSNPLFLRGRVATAQNSTKTCGVSRMRCPANIKRCTAIVAMSWPPEWASANLKQMLVSRRMRGMTESSLHRCLPGSRPNPTTRGRLGGFGPNAKNPPLARPPTGFSNDHSGLRPPAHPAGRRRPQKLEAVKCPWPLLAKADRASNAEVTL